MFRVCVSFRKTVLLVAMGCGVGVATVGLADSRSPWVLYQDERTTVRSTLQFGANLVSEANLFWNLSELAAPDSGYDPDATWLEVYAKPGLTFNTTFQTGVELYGRVSAVASGTLETDAFDTGDTGKVTLEEAFVGLKSPIAEDVTLDLSFGSRELRLGTGMLISDGGSDGFERGALKFGPRRAWEKAGIAQMKAHGFTGTAFYIDPRELPDTNSDNALAGFDARYDHAAGGFLGLTYINVVNSGAPYPQAASGGFGPPSVTPGAREGTETVSVYARTKPFEGLLDGLTFTADYAYQWNDRIDLEAWAGRVTASYAFSNIAWSPTLTYGYQTFSGDDPNTSTLERFDPLYYDGSPSAWATGSKSAMLFINSNVQSHNLTLSLQPTPRDKLTFRYAHVRVNEERSPVQFGQATRLDFGSDLSTVVAGVTDPHLSDDFFLEYSRIINPKTFLTAGVSVAVPGDGIRDVFPGDDPNWVGGFVNVVFNY